MTPVLSASVREVLCLGAHCDDVEIGCGGTLAVLRAARPDLRINVVVFSCDAVRRKETESALARLAGGGGPLEVRCLGLQDGYFPADWGAIKASFAEIRAAYQPELILSHWEGDRHQDHRLVSELTWSTFRDHLILEYEIPKYDGDLGRPGLYVPLPQETVEHKTRTLLECFSSQAEKPWFTADTFSGLMRLRGLECRAASGYAEAFHTRKLLVDFAGGARGSEVP